MPPPTALGYKHRLLPKDLDGKDCFALFSLILFFFLFWNDKVRALGVYFLSLWFFFSYSWIPATSLKALTHIPVFYFPGLPKRIVMLELFHCLLFPHPYFLSSFSFFLSAFVWDGFYSFIFFLVKEEYRVFVVYEKGGKTRVCNPLFYEYFTFTLPGRLQVNDRPAS